MDKTVSDVEGLVCVTEFYECFSEESGSEEYRRRPYNFFRRVFRIVLGNHFTFSFMRRSFLNSPLTLNPPIPILEPNYVVQLGSGGLEDVALLDGDHPMFHSRRDMETISRVVQLAETWSKGWTRDGGIGPLGGPSLTLAVI